MFNRIADPGSCYSFPSRIPDPTTTTKRRGQKLVVYKYFLPKEIYEALRNMGCGFRIRDPV
jgi:hypothetical protein